MQTRRTPRVRLTATGSCKSTRGFVWDIQIDDLSQGGCRVDDSRHGLELGSHIQLMVGEVGPYTAEVAWRQGDRVGLEFITPITPRVFELISKGDWEAACSAAQGAENRAEASRFPVRRIM